MTERYLIVSRILITYSDQSFQNQDESDLTMPIHLRKVTFNLEARWIRKVFITVSITIGL